MKVLNQNDVWQALGKLNEKRRYSAMYSSLYSGIVTDPALMIIPVDDHMAHRGDGVFEALRFYKIRIYLLGEHIHRLFSSGEAIGLTPPKSQSEIKEICHKLCEVSQLSEGILRLYVSRGPGDFSPNPYSTLGAQLYIVATAFKPMPTELYQNGAKLMTSLQPVKPGFYAQVKSCNYLPNVMMKKEAIDKGFDFTVNFNSEGFLAEGPTENIAIVDQQGVLSAPKFDYTLRGTTLLRAFDLAEQKLGVSTKIRDIQKQDLLEAREVMMIGTTLGALPITMIDTQTVAGGRVGGVAQKLGRLLDQDVRGEV